MSQQQQHLVADPAVATAEQEEEERLEEARLQRLRAFRKAHPELSAHARGRSQDSDTTGASQPAIPAAAATGAEPQHEQAQSSPEDWVEYKPTNYVCQLQPLLRCGRVYNGTDHPSDAPPLYRRGQLPPDASTVRVFILNTLETSIRTTDAACVPTWHAAVGSTATGSPYSLVHQKMLAASGKQRGSFNKRHIGGGRGAVTTAAAAARAAAATSAAARRGGSASAPASYDVQLHAAPDG
ncbi:hypothetical protein JKP88DRAFT_242303 [Tribonema minus]|uniref:Uncharacterized protein n=1 Tax=Tribonema minus TaxID=303371 RepID=A0A836C821_9STRA|nr:hypothetical protein JKP88DRAFT_242303 [Tribonema minus]